MIGIHRLPGREPRRQPPPRTTARALIKNRRDHGGEVRIRPPSAAGRGRQQTGDLPPPAPRTPPRPRFVVGKRRTAGRCAGRPGGTRSGEGGEPRDTGHLAISNRAISNRARTPSPNRSLRRRSVASVASFARRLSAAAGLRTHGGRVAGGAVVDSLRGVGLAVVWADENPGGAVGGLKLRRRPANRPRDGRRRRPGQRGPGSGETNGTRDHRNTRNEDAGTGLGSADARPNR